MRPSSVSRGGRTTMAVPGPAVTIVPPCAIEARSATRRRPRPAPRPWPRAGTRRSAPTRRSRVPGRQAAGRRRDALAGAQLDDVAGHDGLGVELPALAVAQHSRPLRDRAPRATNARCDQHDDQRTRELAPEQWQRGLGPHRRDAVGAVALSRAPASAPESPEGPLSSAASVSAGGNACHGGVDTCSDATAEQQSFHPRAPPSSIRSSYVSWWRLAGGRARATR